MANLFSSTLAPCPSQVIVQAVPDARGVVAVTTHPGAVADALTAEWAGLSLESLLPGALVNARVRRVQGDGLLVTFLTFFHGETRAAGERGKGVDMPRTEYLDITCYYRRCLRHALTAMCECAKRLS